MAGDGSRLETEGPHGRASSILAPSAVGRRRRGGPAPGCYPGRGLGHEVRLLHLPPGLSVQWSGRPPVEREITGSSPVRSAAPWWLLATNPNFQSGPPGFDPRPRRARLAESGRRAALRTPRPSGHPGSSPGGGYGTGCRCFGSRESRVRVPPGRPTRRHGAEALQAARPVEARQGEVRFLAAPPVSEWEHDAR